MSPATTSILADTSAWVDYLRNPNPALLPLADANRAATTEPISMEILSGARTDAEWTSLRRLLDRAPLVPFDSVSDFESAARIRGVARTIGLSIGAVDCMILAVALRTNSSLATLDSAQAAVASHLGVEVAPL